VGPVKAYHLDTYPFSARLFSERDGTLNDT
jgi:hypothetical protein